MPSLVPKGKFLCYIDFVVRVLIKTKEGGKDWMVLVAGQITLSLPTDHSHTWKFFQTDYLEWQGGYDIDKSGYRGRPNLVHSASSAGLDFVLFCWSADAW